MFFLEVFEIRKHLRDAWIAQGGDPEPFAPFRLATRDAWGVWVCVGVGIEVVAGATEE